MTVKQAIDAACAAKPNAFPDTVFCAWLSALDGRIALDVFMMAPAEAASFVYHYPGDKNTQLLVSPPHDELYVLYLEAKIDSENGEYNKYNNSMQLYNAAYMNFVTWFEQSYQPSQGYHDWLSAMGRHVDAPYYITAYGIAVKHGFRGSEEEWLHSIGGGSSVFTYYFDADEETADGLIYADDNLTEYATFEDLSEEYDNGVIRMVAVSRENNDVDHCFFAAQVERYNSDRYIRVYDQYGDMFETFHESPPQ